MKVQQSLQKISVELESDDLMKFEKCPACGSELPKKNVGEVQSNPTISLLKCSVCKAVSTSHHAKPEYLRKYYDEVFSKFYADFNEEELNVTFSNPQRFAKHIFNILPDVGSNSKTFRLLDFGGGDGALALAFSSLLQGPEKLEIDVIDYGDDLVSAESDRFVITKHESTDSVDGKYDLIIASASLEHVIDLRTAMNDLIGLLKPEGHLYVRTPYIVPLKRIVPAIDFSFPAHMHDLGVDFWNRVPDVFCEKLGIVHSSPSIVEIDWRTNWYRYLIAASMKLPANIEFFFHKRKKFAIWPYVGGWETMYVLSK
ncbi:class I SAM-dependent methyltransferase [Roseibium sp. HPY-6]|uniref:class I SAM-dependent methyltransferase n=1 Tax=Roseibium sp. HPY-6 TaxID=3229852 RepID=UPI00338F7B12